MLMDFMSDIVRRAEQLAKDKIAKLLIAGQQTGPPTITNPPVATAGKARLQLIRWGETERRRSSMQIGTKRSR